MQLTEQEFSKNISKHQIKVIRDDGVNRHIRFKAPNTMFEHFDVITWPGYLCYTGDTGTYVFQRTQDMFEFFRTDSKYSKKDQIAINPGYWGEKLESVDRHGGFKEFSETLFREAVKSEFKNWVESNDPSDDLKTLLWEEIEDCVLSYADEGEYRAMSAVSDYTTGIKGCDFSLDFYEHDCQDFTYRFMQCCYSVSWAISSYDKMKENSVLIQNEKTEDENDEPESNYNRPTSR